MLRLEGSDANGANPWLIFYPRKGNEQMFNLFKGLALILHELPDLPRLLQIWVMILLTAIVFVSLLIVLIVLF